ncbi:hypothetical protein CAPTEDRAFT_213260 [Capitella teleta]|uniref:CARD domain-containing protein n=1 Tax=Capitella teleta TaxID=283909 RepID=R7UQH1_CAPTE|nr:hypothetical protein CAPTEDRAFT_213260 [Capitella teleta]|eukprot:ELU08358.1 hypothetical protein CAPTEDRAFT_213260 [Capitella teleta]
MDASEKAVLRRKSFLLAHVLRGLDIHFVLRQCQLQGLLTDADVGRITAEDDQDIQLDDLLVSIEQNGVSSFHKICFLFQQLDHEWVAEELRLELLLDKGWLEMDAYLGRESRVLAIRVIENVGKLDMNREEKLKLETEIQAALNGRYQVAKNTWKQVCSRKQSRLTGEKMAIKEDITEMSHKLAGFGHRDEVEGCDEQGGSSSLSEALSFMSQEIGKLETSWKTLEKDNNSLLQEQKLCLQLLGSSNETVDLHEALRDVISKCNGEIHRTKAEVQDKREATRTLDQQIRALRQQTTRQLKEKEAQIDSLLKEKSESKTEAENYVQFIRKLKASNRQTEVEINHWKQKCDVLEKTRRLGYFYHVPVTHSQQLWSQLVDSVVHNRETVKKCKQCSPGLNNSTQLSISSPPFKLKAPQPKLNRDHRK